MCINYCIDEYSTGWSFCPREELEIEDVSRHIVEEKGCSTFAADIAQFARVPPILLEGFFIQKRLLGK